MDEINIILDSYSNKNSVKVTQNEEKKINGSTDGKTFGSVYPTKKDQDEIIGYLFGNSTYFSSSSIDTDYQKDLSLRKTVKDVYTDFGSDVVRILKKK